MTKSACDNLHLDLLTARALMYYLTWGFTWRVFMMLLLPDPGGPTVMTPCLTSVVS